MIPIIDYGMGNLRSVQKAFEKVGVDAAICRSPQELADADSAVLPGVGAFRDAASELNRQGFADAIRDHVAAGKPLLGICLGLQLLFDVSEEDGEHAGLGLIPGRVTRFTSQPGLKIPHMGWNTIERTATPCPALDGLEPSPHVYFVHSYHVVPDDPAAAVLTSDHGGPFVAAVQHGSIFATQFHPEKSQAVGQQMLRNFADQVAVAAT